MRINPEFEAWMKQVDQIADQHGLGPEENPSETDLAVWFRLYEKGKTPQEAWDDVPWDNSRVLNFEPWE